MKIRFPRNIGQKYYGAHYKFLLNLLEFQDLDVELYAPEECTGGFIMRIDDKRVLIDYTNFLEPADENSDVDVYFKYEYSKDSCRDRKNMYPLGKISFHDWGEYFTLRKNIKYNCNTNVILNNQKPRRGAAIRRLYVRKRLTDNYANLVDTEITDRVEFWMKINSCLVSVCVPGQRKDILDRGQFQYMAFGACTMSPRLNIMLPYLKELIPGVHYVECKYDYSDLIEKIEWCKQNRAECIEIGRNAKKLFHAVCTPYAIWIWMQTMITKEKE